MVRESWLNWQGFAPCCVQAGPGRKAAVPLRYLSHCLYVLHVTAAMLTTKDVGNIEARKVSDIAMS